MTEHYRIITVGPPESSVLPPVAISLIDVGVSSQAQTFHLSEDDAWVLSTRLLEYLQKIGQDINS